MNNKKLLNSLALEVNRLLDQYVAIHDQRLREVGSFRSLFRKVNFNGVYLTTQFLLNEFRDFEEKMSATCTESYQGFNVAECEYFDVIENYFKALQKVVICLNDLAQAQYERSSNKRTLSKAENNRLEHTYQAAIGKYSLHGRKMNALYEQFNRPVEQITILGETIDSENYPKLYNWAKTNPDTLVAQLQSIADAWHEGSVRSAMQALESDMSSSSTETPEEDLYPQLEEFKEDLVDQAYEVDKCKLVFMKLHQKRNDAVSGSTQQSLFGLPKYQKLHNEIEQLFYTTEELAFRIRAMEGDYSEYTNTQQQFYTLLNNYADYLFDTAQHLFLFSSVHNEVHPRPKQDQVKYSDIPRLKKKYHELINELTSQEKELAQSFQKMKKEQRDSIHSDEDDLELDLSEDKQQKKQGWAIAATVCGLLGMGTLTTFALLAIIFGHIAYWKIGKEPDKYTGGKWAMVGLMLGYGRMAILVIFILLESYIRGQY